MRKENGAGMCGVKTQEVCVTKRWKLEEIRTYSLQLSRLVFCERRQMYLFSSRKINIPVRLKISGKI